ncbi:MAG TPA: DUF4192 domain-containing protein [Pedococcus sp.]|jgi:hypothetical protein
MNPIRLRGPADLLVTLPYQLGYHLEDCLVVLALHGGRAALMERIDLPPAALAADVAAQLAAPLLRESPDEVVLAAYERDAGSAVPLVDALAEELTRAGIDRLKHLVVRDGRWYHPGCDDGCCPAAGLALPAPADTPAVADFVALEMAPLPSRGSLACVVGADHAVCRDVAAALAGPVLWPGRAGGRPSDSEPVSADAHRRAVERLFRLSLWARVCDVTVTARPVDELSPGDVAELVRSLQDRALRDGVIARLCPGTLPLEALDEDLADAVRTSIREPAWGPRGGAAGGAAALATRRLLARLQWLARAVPDEHCAGVLTVLGSVAWWLGEGSLARVAVERALEHTPGYTLARLLEQMLDHGLRPGGAGTAPALSA